MRNFGGNQFYGFNGGGNMPQQDANDALYNIIRNLGGNNNALSNIIQQTQQQEQQQIRKMTVSRENGQYSPHDNAILQNTATFITWCGKRIICAVHGGFYYFGADAIKLLESQVSYMYTTEYNDKDNTSSFSFGIVPHTHSSTYSVTKSSFARSFLNNNSSIPKLGDLNISGKDCEVIDSSSKAIRYIFNFIVSNVLPATIDVTMQPGLMDNVTQEDLDKINNSKKEDMFTNSDNFEAFMSIMFNDLETADNSGIDSSKAAGGMKYLYDAIDPSIDDAITDTIVKFFSNKLLIQEPWTPDYRTKYISWDAHPRGWFMPTQQDYQSKNKLSYDQVMQQQPQQQSQNAYGGNHGRKTSNFQNNNSSNYNSNQRSRFANFRQNINNDNEQQQIESSETDNFGDI